MFKLFEILRDKNIRLILFHLILPSILMFSGGIMIIIILSSAVSFITWESNITLYIPFYQNNLIQLDRFILLMGIITGIKLAYDKSK